MRESIYLNHSGKIRAQFLDDEGTPFEASNVTVSIYAPGLDPDSDSPTLSNIPTIYLGNGVFEAEVTPSGFSGIWIDEWTGDILGRETKARLYFTVLGAGYIEKYPSFGLKKNNLVEVNISRSVSSADGVPLLENYTSYFTTEYSPLYSDTRKVRLNSGAFLSGIDDDTINLAILEASIEADAISFRGISNEKLYMHARREYVTCKASNILAENVMASNGVLKSKMLGDFRVDYDTRALLELITRMQDNCRRWKDQLQTGGARLAVQSPQGVVKGELDPNRPAFGRQWKYHRPTEVPIGNSKTRIGRRYYKTHRSKGDSF